MLFISETVLGKSTINREEANVDLRDAIPIVRNVSHQFYLCRKYYTIQFLIKTYLCRDTYHPNDEIIN